MPSYHKADSNAATVAQKGDAPELRARMRYPVRVSTRQRDVKQILAGGCGLFCVLCSPDGIERPAHFSAPDAALRKPHSESPRPPAPANLVHEMRRMKPAARARS